MTGATSAGPATFTLALPVDADGDDLPDAYERPMDCPPTKKSDLNLDQNLVNVLNFQNADQDGNGIKDRDDRFAKDGLSNFEKYRGVYLVAPAPGVNGVFDRYERLGAGVRHLFVRGRGFRDDLDVPSGSCGLSATGTPVVDPTLSAANPCPAFQIGRAFQNIGVRVHNVTPFFKAGATELPRTSLLNPAQATLDMVTVIYDASACKGTEACNTTSKLGIRQWLNSTLGYTPSYGTATTYGTSTVYKRAIESYFNNRPYQHRTNDPSRVVTGPDGRPMLAPITIVGDCSPATSGCGTGTDNGVADTGEATVGGQLAGDTYIPGNFTQQLSAFDVNSDGCVELPTVADPTTISVCTPSADSAASPSATKQQVVRSIITHELGHATGVSTHTDDATDVMYRSTINYTREDHFGSLATGLIQIHNKGSQ